MLFRHFYEDHMPVVWGMLRRLGLPDAHLPDALQDVFTVVHRRLPDFTPDGDVDAWLFRICSRTVKDHYRRACVRHEVLDESSLGSTVDESSNAVEQLERLQEWALIDEALSYLHGHQRDVLVLSELDGLGGVAISQTLNIPLGTAYSRLRLAKQRFKKIVLQLSAESALPARPSRGNGMEQAPAPVLSPQPSARLASAPSRRLRDIPTVRDCPSDTKGATLTTSR